MRKFVSRPLAPTGDALFTPASGREPPIPAAFDWDGRLLRITAVLRSWRSTKTDRGDTYLKRHWFELQIDGDARIQVYYDREAAGSRPHWWLYTIEECE